MTLSWVSGWGVPSGVRARRSRHVSPTRPHAGSSVPTSSTSHSSTAGRRTMSSTVPRSGGDPSTSARPSSSCPYDRCWPDARSMPRACRTGAYDRADLGGACKAGGMGKLDNRVALVTGGARGQGAAEARLFASEGAHVFVTDVRAEEGAKTAADIGATFVEHDVTSPDRWAEVVEQVVRERGRLDVLVNNAGVLLWATMTQTSLEDWDRLVAINQTGVFLGMRAVAPQMISQRSGSIINISSIGGMRGSGVCFAYGATKWAVRGMTKGAAQELGPHGIRVNSIHPGIIDTPMMRDGYAPP